MIWLVAVIVWLLLAGIAVLFMASATKLRRRHQGECRR